MPPPKGSASFKRSDAHHKPHLNVVSGSFSSKKRTERTHSRGQSSSQDNRDDDESSPVTTQRKCLSCSCINFFHSLGDDYGDIQQLIHNLGLITALLLSVASGLILTVRSEEMLDGDMQKLAFFKIPFRQFIYPNNTLHPCKGELELKYKRQYELNCGSCLPAADPFMMEHFAQGPATMSARGCDSKNLQRNFEILAMTTPEEAQLFIYENWNELEPWDTPSRVLITNGFSSIALLCSAMAFALFMSVSLGLSNAKEDTTGIALKRWWWPLGILQLTVGYFCLMGGFITFTQTLDALVNVRFPYWYTRTYMDYVQNTHIIGPAAAILAVSVVHFAYTSGFCACCCKASADDKLPKLKKEGSLESADLGSTL